MNQQPGMTQESVRPRPWPGLAAIMVIAAALIAMPVEQGAAEEVNGEESQNAPGEWDLSDLYALPENWQAEYEAISNEVAGLEDLKGTLGRDAGSMLAAFDRISGVKKAALRLAVYASLKFDENRGDGPNGERKDLGEALLVRLDSATSWLAPEILAIGPQQVQVFEANEPKLAQIHGFALDNILRGKPHTLGDEAEAVLAGAGDVLRQPVNVRDILADAELPFKTVKLSDGTEVTLDQANYSKYRQVANRDDRKLVFDTFWGAWAGFQKTLGAELAAEITGNVYQARIRRFPNALAAALFTDNMPESVYRQLVAQVNAALPSFHRYLRLRRQLLGITDELHYYDIYPSMFASDRKYPLAESRRITLEALKPLGREYRDLLAGGLESSWMHAYPQDGKASGAYMNGSAYDVHPYLLLNHNDDFSSLSTFAHEWGHAVHTLLTTKNQPFEKSDYSTFTAETGSIMNEMLLQDYLIRTAKSREDRLFFIGGALEDMRATFFRQTMFAEFQLQVHEVLERGEALSGDRLTQMYCDLLKHYHGHDQGVMTVDEPYCVEWAFIPHFYYGFYVYQYATSMVGAAYFTDQIVNGGKKERENFLNLLRAGGSDYPYELYRKAGLDMTQPEPYQALVRRFDRLMDELEKLVDQ